jgi:hypothetical protein
MKGDQPRIYLSQVSEKFWLNVEATVYYKRLVDDGTDFGGLVIGARAGPEGHTDAEPCNATTYHGRFRHDGNMDFNKELQHHAGSKSRLRHDIWNGNGLPFNTWIGMKYVVRNVENGVKLELYRDLTEGANGGSWVLMGEITDSGGWEAAAPDCDYPTDLIITEGGGVVYIRNSGLGEAQYKWFSVREIDAAYTGNQAPFANAGPGQTVNDSDKNSPGGAWAPSQPSGLSWSSLWRW